VENGMGLFPCLICVKRSSSAAANNLPSFKIQAAESWNTALIPRIYIMTFTFLDIIFLKDSVQILHQPTFEEKIKTVCHEPMCGNKKIQRKYPILFHLFIFSRATKKMPDGVKKISSFFLCSTNIFYTRVCRNGST
jgi:hypothetical protein